MNKPAKTGLEQRSFDTDFEIRTEGDVAFIAGYAAKFNTLSRNLGGFIETIAPGFFNETINRGIDVAATANHNPNILLGKTSNGTLKLKIDDTGFHYEAQGNLKKQSVRDLVADIERRDVTQSSFGFKLVDDSWGATEENYPLRTLVSGLTYDVGPATLPVYVDTSVALRSLEVLTELSLDDLVAAARADELRSFLLTTKDVPPEKKPPEEPPKEEPPPDKGLIAERRSMWDRRKELGQVANPPE